MKHENSITRKFLGEAGARLQYVRKQHVDEIAKLERIAAFNMTQLNTKVEEFEALPTYHRWWLLVRELFGKKHSILGGPKEVGIKSPTE